MKRPRPIARALARVLALGLALGLGLASAAPAGADDPLDPAMGAIDVDEHQGKMLDPTITFTDHRGEKVTIGDYLDGERPVLLTLNYYRCAVLCNVQLTELTRTLGSFEWTPGDENFRVVTVSIDPRETAELAAEKREGHLAALGRGDGVDWAFLTGDALSIKMLAAQLGIGYAYDAAQDQYAHPAVLVFLSPTGVITRYVYGLTAAPRDVKFGLLEAGEGKVGSTVDKIILSCFHYDASLGRYGPFAFGIMRLGGLLIVMVLGTVLVYYWRRERRLGGVKSEAFLS